MNRMVLIAVLSIMVVPALAQTQVPHTFQNGEVIDAGKFNENFDALEQSIDAIPTTPSVPVGTLMMYAAETAPVGYLLADGSAVSRVTYSDLFAVIGTTFGAGDGSSTFNLPNLSQRFPLGAGTGRLVGETGGSEQHELSTAELPAHAHTVNDPGHRHSVGIGGVDDSNFSAQPGQYPAADSSLLLSSVNTNSSITGIVINNTGGGEPFSIMNPYLVVNYIIKY